MSLRGGEQQQEWYVKLNRRAVVPTLIDGAIVVPELNVINEYLDERFPEVPLSPRDPPGRARMRLWTKQLDEDVHDPCLTILSFGIAFRHQYLARGEQGRQVLEQSPNVARRERRLEMSTRASTSLTSTLAVARMRLLLDEMDEALAEHRWLVAPNYTIADAAFTPYIARLQHLAIFGMADDKQHVRDWYDRIKARPSFADAITRWENPDYLALMTARGSEAWPKVKDIMRVAS